MLAKHTIALISYYAVLGFILFDFSSAQIPESIISTERVLNELVLSQRDLDFTNEMVFDSISGPIFFLGSVATAVPSLDGSMILTFGSSGSVSIDDVVGGGNLCTGDVVEALNPYSGNFIDEENFIILDVSDDLTFLRYTIDINLVGTCIKDKTELCALDFLSASPIAAFEIDGPTTYIATRQSNNLVTILSFDTSLLVEGPCQITAGSLTTLTTITSFTFVTSLIRISDTVLAIFSTSDVVYVNKVDGTQTSVGTFTGSFGVSFSYYPGIQPPPPIYSNGRMPCVRRLSM